LVAADPSPGCTSRVNKLCPVCWPLLAFDSFASPGCNHCVNAHPCVSA
jgi:hypothetical protein